MAECAFCNIINKLADAYVIHESDYVVAFLDIDPIHEGHVLIVPKMHEDSIHKIPIPVLTKIMELAQKIVASLEEIYGMDGYSIMQNGGQFCDFGHFHVHVFPRYRNDGFGWNYPQGEFACSDEVAEKIRKVLKTKNSYLSGALKENLEKAYSAYLEAAEDDKTIDELLDECDNVFYENKKGN